jgi:hypothetical protein
MCCYSTFRGRNLPRPKPEVLFGHWPLRFRVPFLMALLTAVPIALYYAIEKPMIRLGSRLANRLSSGVQLPAADAIAQ